MLWPWPVIMTVSPAGRVPRQGDIPSSQAGDHVTLSSLSLSSLSLQPLPWKPVLPGWASWAQLGHFLLLWPVLLSAVTQVSVHEEHQDHFIFLYVPVCQGDRHGQILLNE